MARKSIRDSGMLEEIKTKKPKRAGKEGMHQISLRITEEQLEKLQDLQKMLSSHIMVGTSDIIRYAINKLDAEDIKKNFFKV